ncbi:10568_t:CDS:2, partial [Funneliformis geosporum]
MEQAWRDERQARQQRDDEIINLRDTVCENVYEKCWWKRRYTACTQQAQNLKRYYRNMVTLPDVMQAINYGHSLGVVGFNDGIKTNILADKIAGRFTLPNPFNNNAGNL